MDICIFLFWFMSQRLGKHRLLSILASSYYIEGDQHFWQLGS